MHESLVEPNWINAFKTHLGSKANKHKRKKHGFKEQMWHLRLGPCSCVDVGAVSRVIPSLAHKAPLRPGTYCGGSDVTRATSGWAAAPLRSTQLWKNGICMKASLSFITWDILLARLSSRSLHLSPWLVEARLGPSVVRDHLSPSANSLIASSSISFSFFFKYRLIYSSFVWLTMQDWQEIGFLALCLQLVPASRFPELLRNTHFETWSSLTV